MNTPPLSSTNHGGTRVPLASDYLQTLYAPSECEGFLVTWNKVTKASMRFQSTPSGLQQAADHMLAAGQSNDIYFGWCLQTEAGGSGRGTAATALYSPGIMFDADLKSNVPGVHAKSDLPDSLEDVLAWLEEAGIPAPTQIRSSGNGLYLDWLHSEPVFLRTPAERDGYAALVAAFHRKLIASAKELRGWNFDFTGDLARVTRMPGTWNHKTSPAKPVEVIQ